MNFGRTFKLRERMSLNIRAEFSNIFNRAYWNNPSGTNLTNAQQQQTLLSNGNTNAGFGKLVTTGVTAFGTTANLLPRQGLVVARISF
jgi:hypothetical protein